MREPQLRKCPYQIHLQKSLCFPDGWLITDVGWPGFLWAVPHPAQLMALDAKSKQVKQALGSKPVSSTPAWTLHELLPPIPRDCALTSLDDGLYAVK